MKEHERTWKNMEKMMKKEKWRNLDFRRKILDDFQGLPLLL